MCSARCSAIGRAARTCALLYIDLDQFKLINDTSGHLAGDQLLSQLALVMAEQLRAGDMLARLGGDEFGMLAHDVAREGAQALAERLRARVEGYIYVWEQRSLHHQREHRRGAARPRGTDAADVLSHADAACYMAKDRGRNRVAFLLRAGRRDPAPPRRDGVGQPPALGDRGRAGCCWITRKCSRCSATRRSAPDGPHIELLIRLRDEDGQRRCCPARSCPRPSATG